MKVGVVFPQIEIGPDPAVVRDYAQTAEGLGYTHLLVYDHVVGADLTNRPGWRGAYSLQSQFHEPFVLFGYLAALTRLELVTGVIILPQRQTVLVAKQAAEVDVLTGGNFRLGVGVGWNQVEYEALNENFHNRGRREEEQIEVMRRLWTEESVSFKGRWHTISEAGLNPLPIQRPIPIYVGGSTDPAFRRIGKDGAITCLFNLSADPIIVTLSGGEALEPLELSHGAERRKSKLRLEANGFAFFSTSELGVAFRRKPKR